MATTFDAGTLHDRPQTHVHPSSAAHQAWWLLYIGFVAAPLIAGLDKFTHLMTDWSQYVAPVARDLLGSHVSTFLYAVGVIEVVAAVGVAIKPRVFAYVVAAWLGAIIVNLLLTGQYYDIALRDLGLMLGALALGRLSQGENQR
jgi:hypothetical protein